MRVANHARETGAQMVIIPWSSGAHAPSAALDDQAVTYNPFDGMFSNMNKASSVVYSQFVRKVFAESPSDVALFVDRGHAAGPDKGYGHHIFLPFFGGPDDRLALRFVVQLCSNPLISATVVRLNKTDGNDLAAVDSIDAAKAALANSAVNQPTMHSGGVFQDTVYGQHSTQTRLASDTADNILWARYTSTSSPATAAALSRITFSEESAARPLHSVLSHAGLQMKGTAESWKSLLVVVGRSRRMAGESHEMELRTIISENGTVGSEVPKTLGDVATAFVAAGTTASVLVLQAALSGSVSA